MSKPDINLGIHVPTNVRRHLRKYSSNQTTEVGEHHRELGSWTYSNISTFQMDSLTHFVQQVDQGILNYHERGGNPKKLELVYKDIIESIDALQLHGRTKSAFLALVRRYIGEFAPVNSYCSDGQLIFKKNRIKQDAVLERLGLSFKSKSKSKADVVMLNARDWFESNYWCYWYRSDNPYLP
ncbi:hypothetical protein CWO04_09390 [Vibrio splendidus]|uniref:hypothetical protein n=1 Tax=Vibrio splendidus TaxID=29497 RepID=UPI000D3B63F1|nr:hypothetical protein [Vibrio splendidus]PTP87128.1 hypothetical protein CWO04_09390 [Vibrio splendidus]